MSTVATAQELLVVHSVMHAMDYPSAVFSGIVPDSRHLASGGYHCSVNDLYAHGNGHDYSNVRPDDHDFNRTDASAYDISLSKADMVKAYRRFHAVWLDHSDPRRKYINCINCWSGTGDAVRLDFYRNTSEYASPDHKWHVHGEFRRRYTRLDMAAEAHASIWSGESKASWIARTTQPERPQPPQPKEPQPVPAGKNWTENLVNNLPLVKYGSSDHAAVKRTEALLAAAGFPPQNSFHSDHTPDGGAGHGWLKAVKAFQRHHGLVEDGEVGEKTWTALLGG